MLKLPDILKQDNTLCQQRSKKLFEEKHFIDHRIHSAHKHLLTDILYICIDSLHTYISFLINNSLIKETKRKMLPYEFHSQRSARNNNVANLVLNMNGGGHVAGQRQYDSDRKSRKDMGKNTNNTHPHIQSQLNHHKSVNSKPGLKRTNTQKILSPKSKLTKNLTHKQK